MLVRAADAVKASVLDKPRAGLVESEGNVCRDALAADRKHPVVIAGAGFVARFAPDGYLFDPGDEVSCDVERPEQRGADDQLVAQGGVQQQRQPVVGHRLVLDRAAHGEVFVAW